MKTLLVTLSVLTLLYSCGNSTSNTDNKANSAKDAVVDDGHDHDQEVLFSETRYQNGIELYTEFNALLPGSLSNFHIYLTNIEDSSPLTADLTLIIDGKEYHAHPEGKGAFHLSYKVENKEPKTIKAIVKINSKTTAFDLGKQEVFSCPDVASKRVKHLGDNTITLSKNQQWAAPFGTEEVGFGPFSNIIRTTGELLPAPKDKISIVATAYGVIKFDTNILTGTNVKRGEVIGHIVGSVTDNNIELRYVNAKSELERADKHYKRGEILKRDSIISDTDFEIRKADFRKAEIEFKTISKNYTDGSIKIVSPSNGYITEVLVSEGQHVNVGNVIVTIHEGESAILKANLPKKYYESYYNIDNANFITEYSKEPINVKAIGGKRAEGTLATNLNNPYIEVYFRIPNNKDIVTHSFATVYLQHDTKRDAVTVSESALIENEGLWWVYEQLNGNTFVRRDVTVGESDGSRRVITRGLKGGEIIVNKGANMVKQASVASSIPAAHSH